MIKVTSPSTRKQDPQAQLKKRAGLKYVSNRLAIGLADLKSPLQSSYRRTFYKCSTRIQQTGGQLKTYYCGYRWCPLCSGIRISKAIDAYGPIIAGWDDPQFVTLTLPTVPGDMIRRRFDEVMMPAYVSIIRSIRDSERVTINGQRIVKGPMEVKAIRKKEVTYSVRKQWYHPHFHIVINGRLQAELLRSLWIEKFPECDPKAQHIRTCDEGTMMEMFKYLCKMTTKGKNGKQEFVPAFALDTIFQELTGTRAFQSTGFKLAKGVEEAIEQEVLEVKATLAFKRVAQSVEWEYHQELADWVDHVTGEVLSEYELPEKSKRLADTITTKNEMERPWELPKQGVTGNPDDGGTDSDRQPRGEGDGECLHGITPPFHDVSQSEHQVNQVDQKTDSRGELDREAEAGITMPVKSNYRTQTYVTGAIRDRGDRGRGKIFVKVLHL